MDSSSIRYFSFILNISLKAFEHQTSPCEKKIHFHNTALLSVTITICYLKNYISQTYWGCWSHKRRIPQQTNDYWLQSGGLRYGLYGSASSPKLLVRPMFKQWYIHNFVLTNIIFLFTKIQLFVSSYCIQFHVW